MGGVHRVLVGITGGIAAYKVPSLVRLLRKNGCEVKTALTDAAKTLVGIDALRTLSGNPVYSDADAGANGGAGGGAGGGGEYDMGHIRLSEWADVFLVCPATANTIAKIAGGIADNLISTLALSIAEDKIIVAPAMNSVMWANGATRANINTLAARGVTVLPVGDGELACGVSGPGRMLGVDEIGRYVLDWLEGDKSLKNNGLCCNDSSFGGETPSLLNNDGNSLKDNGLAGNGPSFGGETPLSLNNGGNSLKDNGLAGNDPSFGGETPLSLNNDGNSLKDNGLAGNDPSFGGETPSLLNNDGNSLKDNGLGSNDSSFDGEMPPVSKESGNLLRDSGLAMLKGKTVLISSGPTEEPLDPVRVITNRSSGKMGAALARAALSMGARVVVVSGPAVEPLPVGAEVVSVRTAAEMEREMSARFGAADICVMAAAVSDYRPLNVSGVKIRRSEKESLTVKLTANPDILAGLGALKSERQFLAGFALESGGGVHSFNRATKKMRVKRCDMIVLNRVDTALGKESTAFTILYPSGGGDNYSMMSKDDAARVIFNKINELTRRQ